MPQRPARARGFTLIELMVTVAIVALLAAIAVPAYNQYVFRSRIPAGLEALSALHARMEQRFQDTGNYGNATCGVAAGAADNFSLACVLASDGSGFTATATGTGTMVGVSYSIDGSGNRRTVAHPKGVPATACWSIKGAVCDS